MTTPRLAPPPRHNPGHAVTDPLAAPVTDAELDLVWRPLTEPLTAEVRVRTGRVPLVRYVRLRPDA